MLCTLQTATKHFCTGQVLPDQREPHPLWVSQIEEWQLSPLAKCQLPWLLEVMPRAKPSHRKQLRAREGMMICVRFTVEIEEAFQKTESSGSVCPVDKPACDTTLLMDFGWPQFAATGVVLV